MDTYDIGKPIELSFSRIRAGALVSGLTVTATVLDSVTGLTLLSSTSLPEVGVSGIYTYSWYQSLTQDTQCLVTYTVNGSNLSEYILIASVASGGQAT